MTHEELSKIPFHFVAHLSMENEHCTSYESEDKRIGFCDHVPYKDEVPHGMPYRHYHIDGKVYKTKEKFIEALKDFSVNVIPISYGRK